MNRRLITPEQNKKAMKDFSGGKNDGMGMYLWYGQFRIRRIL